MANSLSKSVAAAVAAGSAVSIASNAALAADLAPAPDTQWYLSLEGGALFADPAVDKTGSFSGSGISSFTNDNFDTELGYRGAAAFGQKFNDNWDWRVGVAYSNFMKNRGSTAIISGSGGSGSSGAILGSTTDLSYLTGDLELGYNLDPGSNFDLRLFAGLRALNSESSLDKFGLGFDGSGGPTGGVSAKLDSEFLGLGPRAGFDFSTRMGDSMLGFSGMAAGAVLFGRLDENVDAQIFTSGGGSFPIMDGDHKSETLYNIEAALGLDLHITDNSVLTIGYRGEYWDKIRGEDKSGSGAPFSVDNDLLAHGPFVRFIARF